jgi:hypothetical protein
VTPFSGENRLPARRLTENSHRYSDATTYFNKIGDQALLPEVAKRVQRGLRTAAVLQNTVVLPPKEVLDLESRKQFDQAYTVLARSVPESDPHRKNLAMLLQLHRDSTPQEQRHEYQTLLAAYQQYLNTLSPDRVRDQYLFEEADQNIARLEPLARQQADRDAQAQLDSAALQIQRGQYSDAITMLSQVTAKAGSVSPELIDEAARKLADARVKSAGEPTIRGTLLVFLWSIPKALLSLLSWLSYALVVAGAFLAIWLISIILLEIRKPSRSILLSMSDRTSQAGTQNDHVLSEQLRREMDLPRPDPDRELRIDTPGEMDGSSLGQLSLRVPFHAAATVFQSNTAVSFGPFSINPVAIFTAIGAWFQPHHRLEIEGELLLLGSDTVCSARLVYGDLTDGGPWEGVATGNNARDQAIRDAAMKILIAIDSEARQITQNPRSLSQLRLGMDLQRRALDDGTSSTLWGQARDCFQQGALEDPGNWLARFNLASAQQKLGLNALAAEQFQELEKSPSLPAKYRPVVLYNHAATIQKTDDDRLARRSMKMMTQILEMPDLEPQLRLLAASGSLAATAVRYARLWRRKRRIGAKHEPEQIRRITSARDEGLNLLQEVEAAVQTNRGSGGYYLNVVLAVTLNALGQIETLLDSPEQARVQYRRALTFLPTFVEANLNLAELYLEKKGSLDLNWAVRAERLLLDAQDADGTNARTQVLLATLYANPVFGKTDDAIKHFTNALPDPTAGQRLGGLYYALGKPSDAIAPLLSSITRDTSLGSSHLLLARCALNLDPGDRRRCDLLRSADSWLKKMAKGKSGLQYKKEAESLLPQMAKALAPCYTKEPPAPPPPAADAPASPDTPEVPPSPEPAR